MIMLIALAIISTFCLARFCLAKGLLRPAQRPGNPSNPAPVSTPPEDDALPSGNRQDGLTWTALDDLQLTRLLTESARRTNPE